MTNKSLTKLLNQGVIKIKKKKTMKKKQSNSAKNYNEFLKKRKSMSNVRNPIDKIITNTVKDMKSAPNLKMIDKPMNQKLVTKRFVIRKTLIGKNVVIEDKLNVNDNVEVLYDIHGKSNLLI